MLDRNRIRGLEWRLRGPDCVRVHCYVVQLQIQTGVSAAPKGLAQSCTPPEVNTVGSRML